MIIFQRAVLDTKFGFSSSQKRKTLYPGPRVSVKFPRVAMARECKCPTYAPATPSRFLGLDLNSCILDIQSINVSIQLLISHSLNLINQLMNQGKMANVPEVNKIEVVFINSVEQQSKMSTVYSLPSSLV